MSANEEAPGAGGNQPEGETKKPGKDSVDGKATRHARAAAARPGTIAAKPGIVIKDRPTADATITEPEDFRRVTPRNAALARDGFAHLPVVFMSSALGRRVQIWRTADGRWWRRGGFVRVGTTRSGDKRVFLVVLYKHANEDDVKFLLKLVDRARSGEGFDTIWKPSKVEWADELTFETVGISRPYEDPYTHWDVSPPVRICRDEHCFKDWHVKGEPHTLDEISRDVDEGKYTVSVSRERGKDWRVEVYTLDFYGTGEDVTNFVNDLQWMRAECERVNTLRAGISELTAGELLQRADILDTTGAAA